MGLDKLRLLTPRRPGATFFEELNAEFELPKELRQKFVFGRARTCNRIDMFSEIRLNTKTGVIPFYYLELNYLSPGGKQPPLTILEINPNKFIDGWKGVQNLVDRIFTDDCPDLKISRIDLNADIEDTSVDYVHGALRIPLKRKSAEIGEVWKNKGIQTFYVGKPPSQLRIYDKIQELRYQGEDVSHFPAVLTRFEWELRHDHCPVQCFSELPNLKEHRPFERLEFLDSVDYYDFRYDPNLSLKRLVFNSLVGKLGANDAIRVLNSHIRHFKRDFRNIVVNNDELKRKIQNSYAASTERFFSNQGADVRFVYSVRREERLGA